MGQLRVVIDLRPLQNAAAAPVTAAYLGNLLRGFAANPAPGEEFVPLLQAGLPDPTEAIANLPIAGRRWLPPTGLLRAAALTTDPFLLRAAEFGTGKSAVYHVAGADLPLGSGIPVVATVLDLAPWQFPGVFQMSAAARFGQRLRARILQDASAVVVGSRLVAREAAHLLHLHGDRIHVVPFAATEWDESSPATASADDAASPTPAGAPPPASRYLVFFARHDARSDVRTLFDTLAELRTRSRPAALDPDLAWPPPLVLVGSSPDDRAEIARWAGERQLVARH